MELYAREMVDCGSQKQGGCTTLCDQLYRVSVFNGDNGDGQEEPLLNQKMRQNACEQEVTKENHKFSCSVCHIRSLSFRKTVLNVEC